MNQQPLCYDDRDTFSEVDQYFFISYSHLDCETVYEDLNALYEGNLNFWYDKKLRLGDCWDESVRERICAENCVGVLLFLSVNTVKSEAVEKELLLFQELKKNKKNFKLIPIAVNGRSVNATVMEAYLSCAEMRDDELNRRLPQERVVNLLTIIPDAALYVARNADKRHIPALLENLHLYEQEIENGRIFCSNESLAEKISKLPVGEKKNDKTLFCAGLYPQDFLEVSFYLKEGVQSLPSSGGTVTVERGTPYLHAPIKWVILRCDNEKILAVSEKIYDSCYNDTLEACIEAFRVKAFQNDSTLRSLRVLEMDVLEEHRGKLLPFAPTNYARRFGNFEILPTYWGKANGRTVEFYVDGGAVKIKAISARNHYAGLGLMAEFDTQKLLERYA